MTPPLNSPGRLAKRAMRIVTPKPLLLAATLVLLAGCSLTRPRYPEVRGSLSSQDVADVQAGVRETTKAALLRVDASGQDVFAYTGERTGGIVYLSSATRQAGWKAAAAEIGTEDHETGR